MSDSPHFDGKRFHNLSGNEPKGFSDLLRWLLSRKRTPWPRLMHAPVQAASLRAPDDGELAVAFVNHSTFLLQVGPTAILTDPIYSERASPLSFAGPRRARPPGIALRDLPKIDVVLLSHDHYDHMDISALREIERLHSPLFVTSLGNSRRLKRIGISHNTELDWWQTCSPLSGLEIIATPAEHFSGRSPFDRNRTLWCGFYLVWQGWKVFFAGDTAYGSHFKSIRERLGEPDLALLPIGAYRPRWFMRNVHMDPGDALEAHRDLAAGQSIGTHFGTFPLTDEGFDDPPRELEQAISQTPSANSFHALGFGEQRLFPPVERKRPGDS